MKKKIPQDLFTSTREAAHLFSLEIHVFFSLKVVWRLCIPVLMVSPFSLKTQPNNLEFKILFLLSLEYPGAQFGFAQMSCTMATDKERDLKYVYSGSCQSV